MVFIRIKKIYGNKYAYKVHNEWTKYGPRQKNLGYLGRVCEPKKVNDKSFEEFLHNVNFYEYLHKTDHKQIINDLMEWELLNHGFEQPSNEFYQYDDVFVGLEMRKVTGITKTQTEKKACIKMNQGFLCDNTMRDLFHFKLTDSEDLNIYNLANAFVGAGINVPKDVFVKIYEKILKGQ